MERDQREELPGAAPRDPEAAAGTARLATEAPVDTDVVPAAVPGMRP